MTGPYQRFAVGARRVADFRDTTIRSTQLGQHARRRVPRKHRHRVGPRRRIEVTPIGTHGQRRHARQPSAVSTRRPVAHFRNAPCGPTQLRQRPRPGIARQCRQRRTVERGHINELPSGLVATQAAPSSPRPSAHVPPVPVSLTQPATPASCVSAPEASSVAGVKDPRTVATTIKAIELLKHRLVMNFDSTASGW